MEYINIIANDKKIIGFRPEIKRVLKSTNATILLQQIIYWYVVNDNKPFYKFIEPCDNEKYRDGDSWEEELALSKKEFSTALQILKELDLVSTKINLNRVTYYDVNESNLEQFLEGIYLSDQRVPTKVTKGNLAVSDQRAPTEVTKGNLDYSKTMLHTENTAENTHNNKDDVGFITDKDFTHLFFVYARNTRFAGKKKEAYEAFKTIKVDAGLLELAIKRYLHDDDINKKVGFKKFINDGIYLAYIPNLMRVKHEDTWFTGTYNLDDSKFYNQNGIILGDMQPSHLLKLYQDKCIEFLDTPKYKQSA